jgi:hypothetical protein
MFVDILQSEPFPLVVNTAAAPPTVVMADSGSLRTFDQNGHFEFHKADNLRIVRARLWLPYYFILSTLPAVVNLAWKKAALTINIVNFPIAQVCEWQELSIVANWQSIGANTSQSLGIQTAATGVSMVGVPASLNGATLNGCVLLQVEHSLAMV